MLVTARVVPGPAMLIYLIAAGTPVWVRWPGVRVRLRVQEVRGGICAYYMHLCFTAIR